MSVSLRKVAIDLFSRSLDACKVEKAFHARVVAADPERPHVLRLTGDGDIDLSDVERLLLIGVGKGAASLMQACMAELRPPAGCELQGVLIAPAPMKEMPPGIAFFAGGHPLPNEASLTGAKAALSLLHEAGGNNLAAKTFCVFLISGGASAMMELPLDESLSLSDVLVFHRALIHSGASISEINCVRKHFSAVKGGRLGLAAQGIRSVTFAVSDVPSGHLDALGSGPTLPDTSTIEQCRQILKQYALLPQFSPAVRTFFEGGLLTETPKPGGLASRVYTLLSDQDLAEAARSEAARLGFTAVVDNTCDDWDVEDAAEYLLDRLRGLRNTHSRVCLISVGEVTVSLPDGDGGTEDHAEVGLGGRNQQFALYAASLLVSSDRGVIVLSAGSDGIDGNSAVAGAVVGYELLTNESARQAAERALRGFDAGAFLAARSATIVTGPTGNNLRDLRILLAVDEGVAM